jgi:hypothetical protein
VSCFSVHTVVCVFAFRLLTAQIPPQLIEAYRYQVRCKHLVGFIVFVKSRQQYRVVPVVQSVYQILETRFHRSRCQRPTPLLLNVELGGPLPPRAFALVLWANVPASAPVL